MAKILIILDERTLYLYQNNQVVRSFPVAIGKASTPTPTGNFSIINKLKNPYNKALGTRWMQFTHRMHGIHGNNQPSSIGKAISNGCVRMYNKDAEFLYDRVSIGTPVEIRQNRRTDSKNKSGYSYYTVKTGDTLYQIAKKFNTTVEKIIAINPNIKNKNTIYPGQQIKIPD
ncbi:LysM domain-containing protein [Orenia metallireducens]|uniref:LysM domain-containing protein n=1 Tax=Orenia metallireducens TaxID=1413210 RepID=A0A285GZH2_9FIRM|nr:L,D-transpeptidase family protein [Orenia metallireducens]PRX26485.1 LysM domain-containing protein [Orenia metallireducens]SNY28922.1 LysM domain-containing protein [Orenia metallireducens]